MQAIRIKLTQKKAHYGRPECVDNRMTYPLPPYSTIIGALHAACGYTTYHPMDIGIQGKFQSMQKEVYTNQILLNRREDDRGILVYLQNPDLFTAGYEIVGKALKTQGNSFRKNITIDIVNSIKMQEYWDLLNLKDILDEEARTLKDKIKEWKKIEKQQKEYLKSLDKKSKEYKVKLEQLNNQKEEWTKLERELKDKKEVECEIPLSHYRTLTKGPKYVEVLYDIELVFHIKAQEKILCDIEKSIYNLTCLGRSEDFVDIIEMKRVELTDEIDKEYSNNEYTAYIKRELLYKDDLDEGSVFLRTGQDEYGKIPVKGTTYYLPKNYEIGENGRNFDYKWVNYMSNYSIDEESTGIYLDEDKYIVDFV